MVELKFGERDRERGERDDRNERLTVDGYPQWWNGSFPETALGMKIAVSSSSFAAALHGGALTQLEWLEACASRLDVDGVVFALADFPRTDAEYAAQVKKIAVDLGLVPVALDAPGLLDPDVSDDARTAAVALAAALGTSLLRVTAGPPGDVPPQTHVRTVAVAKALARATKAANVSLALAPAAGSLVADIAGAKHLLKDVDSAWLRYDIASGDPDRASLGARDRILIERFSLDAAAAGGAPSRRGWNLIDGPGGDDPFVTIGAAVRALRSAEARAWLAESGTATTDAVYVPG